MHIKSWHFDYNLGDRKRVKLFKDKPQNIYGTLCHYCRELNHGRNKHFPENVITIHAHNISNMIFGFRFNVEELTRESEHLKKLKILMNV